MIPCIHIAVYKKYYLSTVHDDGDNPSGETSSGKGYDQNQRRKLDDLVEKSR